MAATAYTDVPFASWRVYATEVIEITLAAVVSVVVAGGVSAAAGYRTFEHPTAAAQGIRQQERQKAQTRQDRRC